MVSPATIQNNPVAQEIGKVWQRSSAPSKAILLGTSVACYALFWWTAGLVGLTSTHGFYGSIFLGPSAIVHLIVTSVLVLAAVAIGTVAAGYVRPDAGLFAAAIGLLALTNRAETITSVLQDGNGDRRAYLFLAAGLISLYLVLGAGGWIIHVLQRHGKLQSDSVRDGLKDAELPRGAGWMALGLNAVIMAIVVVILAQSEDKKQVVAAVALGSFAGAFFPYWQPSARPSVWYWTGPLVVGVFGYVLAFVSPSIGIAIGRPGFGGGFLIALARPLPLDYAGIGTAGAILGYWMRRKSLREREMQEAAENAPETASISS